MTAEKAILVLHELTEVLRKHDVEMEDDRQAGICLQDGFTGPQFVPWSHVQYHADDKSWRALELG